VTYLRGEEAGALGGCAPLGVNLQACSWECDGGRWRWWWCLVGGGVGGTLVAMVASATIATLVVGELEQRRVCAAVETAQSRSAAYKRSQCPMGPRSVKNVEKMGEAKVCLDLSR
jgi:hypothetical protein